MVDRPPKLEIDPLTSLICLNYAMQVVRGELAMCVLTMQPPAEMVREVVSDDGK